MKTTCFKPTYLFKALFLVFGCLFFGQMQAQPCIVVDDTICVELGEMVTYNVTSNDSGINPGCPVSLKSVFPCGDLRPDGLLFLTDSADCCGEYILRYEYEGYCTPGEDCFGEIFLTIKCPKPDCFLTNLEDYQDPTSSPAGIPAECAYACEFSEAVYYVPYVAGNTYSWSVSGGAYTIGSNAAEIVVDWGTIGSGNITLVITDASSITTTLNLCVDILESPIAAFQPLDTCVCKNGPISFMNMTVGGNDYYWDFGDGNSSTAFEPTHTYSSPGTYTVTLYATRNNFATDGSPLCCCSDSISMDITVDSLEGPNIYWVSTLCEGDSSKYWTDASNCGTYNWTVTDADGVSVPFSPFGSDPYNDTICVSWGDGPFGIIQLEVVGCDSNYCTKPSTVLVPIIQDTAQINGPTVVCEGATETYTLPKWISTFYDWQVTGGVVISGDGTNSAVIQWGSAAGSPGTITVNYYSDFLSGLPGHSSPDCEGVATLDVEIKPEFSISGPMPAVACVNSTSFFNVFPSGSYTWTVTPSAPQTPFGSGISVDWTTGPGSYVITAVPNDTTLFCNGIVSFAMTVIDLPVPDSISGPDEICPGESYTYFAHSGETGVTYNWTVIGGTPTSATGDVLNITWNALGPYSIALSQTQLGAPGCTSDTIGFQVSPLLLVGPPLLIIGTGDCTNGTGDFILLPTQHPDTEITWAVSPATSGSIIQGQGNDSIRIQWNNDPGPVTISVTIELCGVIKMKDTTITLTAAPPPTITQTGILCPGQTAILNAGSGYSSYNWSTGATTQSITISSGGDYTVMVTAGGCPSVATFTATEVEGPDAMISTPDPTVLCRDNPDDSVVLHALTNPNYVFQWYCGGTAIVQPPTQATFTHYNMGANASYNYRVEVTDITTGCQAVSNTIVVEERDTCRLDSGCIPQTHLVEITSFNFMPACNRVEFNVNLFGPVSLIGWNFGDPFGNTNSGTLMDAQHAYLEAGYYTATLTYRVPEAAPGTGFCVLTVTESVCIPVGANFEFVDSCGTVCFTDLSTYLPGNTITDWSWTFGDGGTSSSPNPKHTYSAGSYNIVLVVETANFCEATFTLPITIAPPPVISAAISPNPACVGDSIGFAATGTGIISWLWDYGDGATNAAQNNAHSYSAPGLYTVSLTGVNTSGCSNTIFETVEIFALPPEDTITYSPSLTICEGETTTLTAPAGAYTYLWSSGETTASINVGVAGSYSVTYTDINGCSFETDEVTVTVIPAPLAVVSGSLFICDAGCTTLSAPAGFMYTYQWIDNTGSPIGGATGQTLDACDFSLLAGGYAVIVTNANGCSDTSDLAIVSLAVSPSFSITVAGDTCEGSPNLLSINAPQPNVVYTWSNGGSGTSTTAILAGTYTAIGTDTLTGCTGSASAIIHPLPDLCIVPVGCYEVCNPDTICGPPGLAAYQWNMNGIPISGETGQCLIVMSSGSYSLTGTTDFGCSLTSDTLILEVIECDTTVCDSVDVMATPLADTDSCCWSLDLSNSVANYFIGIRIDALGGVDLDYSGSPAGWLTFGSSSSHVILAEPSLSFIQTGMYTGTLDDVAEFCLSGYTTSPQQVVVSWLIPSGGPLGYDVACTDTLEMDCEPPACIAIIEDSIYCENDTVKYTFYLENQSLAYSLETISFNVDLGLSITVDPNPLAIPPIPPLGIAGPFTVCLSGADVLYGNNFKFTLSAHDGPLTGVPIYCCTDTTEYCIPIPSCDACDKTDVFAVKDTMECCYNISIGNNFANGYFTGIQTTLITPGAEFGAIAVGWPPDWIYSFLAPNSLDWDLVPLGMHIPTGIIDLPKICLDGNYADTNYLVINWLAMAGVSETIVCSDTIALICDPIPDPCLEVLNDTVFCKDGKYYFGFNLVNNSGYDIDEIDFTAITPGFTLDPITIMVADGDTSAFLTSCIAGPLAVEGASFCFHVTLHALLSSGGYFACCSSQSDYCYTLPGCDDCEETNIQDDNFTVGVFVSTSLDVLNNDGCPTGYVTDPSTVVVTSGPYNGSVPIIFASGNIAYSSGPGFVGIDSFTYEVCCVNPIGEELCCEATVIVNVIPDIVQDTCDASQPVTGLMVSFSPSGTVATLTWNALINAAGYQIQGRPLGFPSFGTLTSGTNSISVGGLNSGQCYEWKVRAGCDPFPSAIGPFSELDTFCAPALRLAAPLIEAELVPNPVTDFAELRIQSEVAAQSEIVVADLLGRELLVLYESLEAGESVIQLDVSEFDSGLYTILVRTVNGEREIKFAVAR